jgi:hypothetical protein
VGIEGVYGQYANTSFDTKGIPLKGVITGKNGQTLGRTKYFGEGTDTILFDGSGREILRDSHGKITAGFEAEAIDPKLKIKVGYDYWWKSNGKDESVRLGHGVSKSTFRSGKLTITNPDVELESTYKIKGKMVTLVFKGIEQSTDKSGGIVNTLIITTHAGRELRLLAEPTNWTYCRLTDGGDLGRFLSSQGPQD